MKKEDEDIFVSLLKIDSFFLFSSQSNGSMTKHLFNEFPEYTKQDREDRIIKDLKDRPKEELTLQVEDGIKIRPDYAGISSKEYTQSYRSKNRWLISSELTVDCTNRDVLACTANGCNSLLIHINSNTDITKLLKDVMLDILDSTLCYTEPIKALERKPSDYLKKPTTIQLFRHSLFPIHLKMEQN